jgi:hypothetical protein
VERLAALSVDLDEIDCYAQIHGLESVYAEKKRGSTIYERAIPRYERLFGELGVPATFFAIGRDVAHRENRPILRRLALAGHEIGNHTENHHYDFVRYDRETMREEIARAHDRIADATGKAPIGFRAPGYATRDRVFELLGELGYRYDSSVFPSPPYYAAKAAAMAVIRVRGRRSRSILDDPRMLTAPADPYRVGKPYWRRGTGMIELPIGVTRGTTGKLPYIGTTVVLAGEDGARRLTNLVSGRPLVNLELHGIDLADASADGLEWLRPHQPDLRRSAMEKEAALKSAVHTLRAAGYRFVTLSDAAGLLATPTSSAR